MTNHYTLLCSCRVLVMVSLLMLTSAELLSQPAPQFALPGQFGPSFAHLNNIHPDGTDLDGNGSVDLRPPCSCVGPVSIANGATTTGGLFRDQLIVATGISGQTWKIEAAAGVLNPDGLQPWTTGKTLPEVGNTGIYVLPFVHRDNQGYVAQLISPQYPGQSFGPVENTCYYPRPQIFGIDNFYCGDQPDIFLDGYATSGFSAGQDVIFPQSEFFYAQRQSDGQTYPGPWFRPGTVGNGRYTIYYQVDAGEDAFNAPDRTGCVTTVSVPTIVRKQALMGCNTSINVSLGTNCQVSVTPQLLLAAEPLTWDHFTIELRTQQGVLLSGNTIPPYYAGQTIRATIIDDCSGLDCETTIQLRDQQPPVLNVPPDVVLNCTDSEAPAHTGFAQATDCTQTAVTYTDVTDPGNCSSPSIRINRIWKAVDAAGNTVRDTQLIRINRGGLQNFRFPRDTLFSCEAYRANPGLTDAKTTGAGVPDLVDQPRCGLLYTWEDDTLRVCNNAPGNFIIVREWTVVNECGTVFYNQDGAGNDNIQLISVRDTMPPQVTAGPITLRAEEPPVTPDGSCACLDLIPPPAVISDCSDYRIRIFTPVGEAIYVNGVDGAEGGFVPGEGLPLGQHPITYELRDACGNRTTTTVTATVIDELPPTMLCDASLNLTLKPNGTARIFPDNVNEGSRDDCCDGDLLIKLSGEDDTAFRPYIDFYCTNDVVTVVLRMWDCSGNYSDCETNLRVEDRQPVKVVSAPPDTSLLCGQDYQQFLSAQFRAPAFSDNCQFTTTFSITETVDECGQGQLLRTWTARDNPTNTPAVVNQRVTLLPKQDFRLELPGDGTISCSNDDAETVQILRIDGCDSLSITVTEEFYTDASTDTCYFIRRTHEIINHCRWDGLSAAVNLPRRDGSDAGSVVGDPWILRVRDGGLYAVFSQTDVNLQLPATGRYRYEQIIAVMDEEKPELVAVDTLPEFCLTESAADCRGAVDFYFRLDDNCTDSLDVLYRLRRNGAAPAADTYGQLSRQADGYRISGAYPAGDWIYVVSAFDACGNYSEWQLPFRVVDCSPPEVVCRDTFAVPLQSNGKAYLLAFMAVDTTWDHCGQTFVELSFDSDGGGDSPFTFTCDSLGLRTLTLYATDATGNQDQCQLTVEVVDPQMVCHPPRSVEGFVRRETGDGIPGVTMLLSGLNYADTVLTDIDGFYYFENIPSGGTYKITPLLAGQALNGVTTLDIIRIRRHILSEEPLASPYRMLAGDANMSQTISTADVIKIRKVILGIDPDFNNGLSWRFLPMTFSFQDPLHPWLTGIPQSATVSNLTTDLTVEFMGVKLGDVNDSAVLLE